MTKLTLASLRMLYRDRQALFWALAFPVIFAVVFGLFDFSATPEATFEIVAPGETPVSEALAKGLGRTESFTVERGDDLEAARERLGDGEVDVVLAIPESSGDPAAPTTIELLYNESNQDVNQVALGAVERVVNGLNLRLAGVTSPPVGIEAEGVAGKTVEYYDFLLPGLVAMGVMNFSITGMAVALAQYREKRILKRILATPLRPSRFLAAQVLARLVLAVVQAALILLVGVYAFGATIYGNVVWIFVLTTVANLIFLNIGFAIAGRVANPDAAQGVASAVALPMMFLSGVFFPTDTLPAILRSVVAFLPLTPLIEALRTVSVEGLPITETGPQLLLLGSWVLVSFGIAAVAFRFEGSR
jgi:ABC-2 type transport system permease protein